MKLTISPHFLGTKGLSDNKIREYYKNLRDVRKVAGKCSDDRWALESLYELPGGLRFFYQEWPVSKKGYEKVPKAIVCALHGAYESSDMFYPLADFLNAAGILVVSFDYRGHGRTGGQAGGNLGDLQSFKDIIQDATKILLKYHKQYDRPLYLLGYDIGALVAMRIAVEQKDIPIAGAILVAPVWRLKDTLKHIALYPLVFIGESFAKGEPNHAVWPEEITPTTFEEYKILATDNPFRLKKMSLRLFRNLLDLITQTQRFLRLQKIPVVIFQGTADSMVDHFAVHSMFKRWPHPNKLIRLYENAGHNLLVDRFTIGDIQQEILRFLGITENL